MCVRARAFPSRSPDIAARPLEVIVCPFSSNITRVGMPKVNNYFIHYTEKVVN